MRSLSIVSLLCLTIAAPSAFALAPKGLCSKLPGLSQGNRTAAEKAAAKAWEKRGDMAQLQKAINHWNEATTIDPKKASNWMKLGSALYLMADGHMRFNDELEDEMSGVFARAVFAFERVLKLTNEEYTFSVCARDPIKKVISTIRKQDVPAIYWYATALGKYGLSKSITELLGNKDRIYKFIRRVGKLQSDYNYGAPDRYLGAFFTKIPFPKGDLVRSRKHFERSIRRAPKYLATRVLMAKMLAPKLKDRALFKEQLDYVINAKEDIIPELVPEHKIEKRKAKALLGDIDDLFPKGSEG